MPELTQAELTAMGEDFIEHFGVKGMHWGVRSGKSKTGVSRARGARIDRNDRHIALFKDMSNSVGKKGAGGKVTGTAQRKIVNGINRATMGKNLTKKYYDVQIKRMESHNERLKSGKVTVRDRLGVALTTTPASLLVSYRPKD